MDSLTEAAVIVCDPHGVTRGANPLGCSWLTSLTLGRPFAGAVPHWLAAADTAGSPAAHGLIGDRHITARRAELPDRHYAWYLSDGTAARDARREIQGARSRTRFLAEASSRLLSSLNLRKCVAATAELAVSRLADAAVVITPPERRRITLVRTVAGRPGNEQRVVSDDPRSMPGLAEALAGFPPVPSRWIDPQQAPDWILPEGFGTPGSVLVTPLPGNGVPAGVLILMRRGDAPAFDESEETFARIFAARAGAAISAAVLYGEEARTAALLQRDLLPPSLGPVKGLELAGSYRPATDTLRIGGDFYDAYEATAPGGETTVVLGDVCGKGLEAAVLTGKIRNTLSALRLVEPEHGRLLSLLNHSLLNADHARFATLVLAGVTPIGHGRLRLRLTAGGHPAPLILRADGRVQEADTSGTLIGAIPDVRATTFTTVLEPGESCLLFSDGVTEAKGGVSGRELFGTDRLKRVLAECGGMPVATMVEHVDMRTSEWLTGGLRDDIALVGIATPRGAHLSAVNGHGPGRYTR